MKNKTGETVNLIRQNKGYSQKYVSTDVITQGAYSKFEKLNTNIRLTHFDNVLSRLEVSYDEFKYIQAGYEYSYRDKMINKLFGLTYNDKELLERLLEEAREYLKHHEDTLIENLSKICESLILLRETNNIEKACIPLVEVWERLSKRSVLYIMDIYFINSMLFLFPIETALGIKNFTFRNIDKYKNFQKVERLKINITINIMLLLMKEHRFEEVLVEVEEAISLCKKHADYLRLAICYIRKGICLNHTEMNGDEWIMKGKNILTAIEEFNILKIFEDEIVRHNIT